LGWVYEASGAKDLKTAWDGVDPDTGEKLSMAQRLGRAIQGFPGFGKGAKFGNAGLNAISEIGCNKGKGKGKGGGAACTHSDDSKTTENDDEKNKKPIDNDYDTEDKLINEELDKLKEEGLEIDEQHLEKFVNSLKNKGYNEQKARNIARAILLGNAFNKKMRERYPYNEVHVNCPKCKNGYAILDSYDPIKQEIVSRKYTQLWKIKPETAKSYIRELVNKYPPGQVIKDVPTQKANSGHQNAGLANFRLQGRMFLEVPVQDKEVPKEILDYATSKDIYIRDENGKILNPH